MQMHNKECIARLCAVQSSSRYLENIMLGVSLGSHSVELQEYGKSPELVDNS